MPLEAMAGLKSKEYCESLSLNYQGKKSEETNRSALTWEK